MGADSKIEWTQHTFQAWVGCSKVSPACDHCYAESKAKRAGWNVWGVDKPRKMMREAYWKQPLRWNRDAAAAGVRARVFCASLADVFEDRPELVEPRERLGAVIEETPWLDWLLLSKRPENMVRLAPERWAAAWPRNVWAGCTVEDQKRAEERVPWLLEVPAVVRFLSVEPMLGPVDLEKIEPYYLKRDKHPHDPIVRINALTGLASGVDEYIEGRISWVIVGGESGGGSRPFDLRWARDVVRQCREAQVACFVKQFGDRPVDSEWQTGVFAEHDKRSIEAARYLGNGAAPNLVMLRTRKGGDPIEWPADLRVRQFPEVA